MALFKPKGKSAEVMPPDLQNAEARLQQSDLVNTNVPSKKSVSPALLGGGALGLVALSLGAWHFLGPKAAPDETDTAPVPTLLMSPSSRSSSPGSALVPGGKSPITNSATPEATGAAGASHAGAAHTKTTLTKTTSTHTVVGAGGASTTAVTSTTSTKTKVAGAKPAPTGQHGSVAAVQKAALTQPGRLGLPSVARNPGAPEFAPSKPGEPPRMAPVQGAPTPVQPPDNLEGTPGRRGGRNEVVISSPLVDSGAAMASGAAMVPGAAAVAPERLKELWNQGAAAKQRGDIKAARRAWSKILQLSPGHPGIREALNKLR